MHGGNSISYRGDVFLVKMALHEFGKYVWAAYNDVALEFLDLLIEGLYHTGWLGSFLRTRILHGQRRGY